MSELVLDDKRGHAHVILDADNRQTPFFVWSYDDAPQPQLMCGAELQWCTGNYYMIGRGAPTCPECQRIISEGQARVQS